MEPRRNIGPSPYLLPSPHSAQGFVRLDSQGEEPSWRLHPSSPTPFSAGLGPALIGSQPLALFPWLARPASVPQPPLSSPLSLSLQAPSAPPPANVALGPGPGPDSATRPFSEPRIQ